MNLRPRKVLITEKTAEIKTSLVGDTPAQGLLYAVMWGVCAVLAEHDPTIEPAAQQVVSYGAGAVGAATLYSALKRVRDTRQAENAWQQGLRDYRRFMPRTQE